MPEPLGDELSQIAERLSAVAARADDLSVREPLSSLMDAADSVARSWSRSNIGFHALVYYAGLVEPPPGAHFSPEWGFLGQFQGTTGNWQEFPHDAVIDRIEDLAGRPDLALLDRDADDARRIVEEAKHEVRSIVNALMRKGDDAFLADLLERVEAVSTLSYDTCLQFQMPSGQIWTRDTSALSQGLRSAPHQEVIARVIALRSPFESAAELSAICGRAVRHLRRIGGVDAPSKEERVGDRVVIGHGRSALWRELKDFVADRLRLPWDEFNRVSVAGVATVERLQEMLDHSCFALLVATAEDETADGDLHARQNVIHEIGLFQGRLGFGRAIVLLEEGCEEFSNIHGLGQIRFPKGNIAACFEDVRKVLERESVL